MADPVFVDDVTPLNAVNMNKLQTRDEKAVANGYPSLDSGGKVPSAQLPVVVSVPVGAMMQFLANTPPSGWLMCDGASLDRAVYAALFGVIGTVYGAADGTHFSLPDLRGRVPVGQGTQADVNALGDNDGEAVGSRSPRHQHSISDPQHAHSIYDPGHAHNRYWGSIGGGEGDVNGRNAEGLYGGITASGTGIGIYPNATGITVGPAGYPTDMPAYIVVNYIVKT